MSWLSVSRSAGTARIMLLPVIAAAAHGVAGRGWRRVIAAAARRAG